MFEDDRVGGHTVSVYSVSVTMTRRPHRLQQQQRQSARASEIKAMET